MHWVLQLLTICSVILSQSVMAQRERKLITFNAALQLNIPLKVLRRQTLIMGLKAFNADVVCLQEVYDGSDIKWLTENLRKQFPYSVSFNQRMVNNVTKKPKCKVPEIFIFLECMSSHCSGYNMSDKETVISTLQCLLNQCATEMFRIPQVCLTCFFLLSNSRKTLNVCLNPKTEINVPGLLLFSKQKMITAYSKEHHPGVVEIAKQGYLVAKIETIGTVVCTHLATPFLGNLYPEELGDISVCGLWVITQKLFESSAASLSYGSYEAQNKAEVDQILNVFKDTKPLVLAGDFNTGPEGVCEYNPDSYRVLTSPQADLEHTILDKCTFCNDNTWNKQECDWTIDHVFLRGLTLKGIKRIFSVPKVRRKLKRYHVSDHYGVMATFIVDQS